MKLTWKSFPEISLCHKLWLKSKGLGLTQNQENDILAKIFGGIFQDTKPGLNDYENRIKKIK